jgi:hypothetical protein
LEKTRTQELPDVLSDENGSSEDVSSFVEDREQIACTGRLFCEVRFAHAE